MTSFDTSVSVGSIIGWYILSVLVNGFKLLIMPHQPSRLFQPLDTTRCLQKPKLSIERALDIPTYMVSSFPEVLRILLDLMFI